MNATVIDLENKELTVDLEKIDDALESVDFYRNAKHEEREFGEMDDRLNSYWNDLYNKLNYLKKQQDGID